MDQGGGAGKDELRLKYLNEKHLRLLLFVHPHTGPRRFLMTSGGAPTTTFTILNEDKVVGHSIAPDWLWLTELQDSAGVNHQPGVRRAGRQTVTPPSVCVCLCGN